MVEIGVRMALGATRSAMVWLVLGNALRLAVIGTATGIPLAVAVGRVSKTLLYRVTALDPITLAATVFLLIGIAALAAAVPGRRASLLDPSSALKSE
jgi:ABC-type antimicrobial peptide transport system permease subunit